MKVARPPVVSIPHKLGKDEAIRRMKAGLGSVKTGYGQLLQVNEEIWSGDCLAPADLASGACAGEINQPAFLCDRLDMGLADRMRQRCSAGPT